MLAGIEAVLRRADLDVLVYHVETGEERRRFFERLPARRKVDAIVVIAMPLPEAEAERLDLMGVQVVVAGGQIRDYPHVRIDDIEVAHQVVDHLTSLGHTRIAMIRTSDPAGSTWSGDLARTHGFRIAMDKAGLDVRDEHIVTVPYAVDGGALAMDRLLSLPDRPTAVFAYSDEVAAGALRSLRRAKVAVPEQMSVIGVDNHPIADLLDLTTVHQPVEAQGQAVGQMLVDIVEGRTPRDHQIVLPTHLVVRSTTSAPGDSS
jgi:DNA-binding LacI/PurR family transcriptional regulator